MTKIDAFWEEARGSKQTGRRQEDSCVQLMSFKCVSVTTVRRQNCQDWCLALVTQFIGVDGKIQITPEYNLGLK